MASATPEQLDTETQELMRTMDEEMKLVQEHSKRVEQCRARIATIYSIQAQWAKEKEDAQMILDYEKYKQGDQSIYERYLEKLLESKRSGTILKRGVKWDTLSYGGNQLCKVEKRTGDIYHTGKYPLGHLIHPKLYKKQ